MASADWAKHNSKSVTAIVKVHLSDEGRQQYHHSNENIDKSKSYLNYCIGCDDMSEALQNHLARVAEVDEKYPPLKENKDRKTCVLVETPCPQAIADMGKSDEFFQGIYHIMSDYFGAENVHGSAIHKDEVHEYKDKDGIHKSLEHAHTIVTPYLEWQEEVTKNVKQENGKYKKEKIGETRERKGINCKNFMDEKHAHRMTNLNNLIDDYCRETFGVSFLTGGEARKKTVEQLKTESKNLELEQQTELVRQQALEYEYPEKKGLLESQKSYDEKVKIHQAAVAIEQSKQAISGKEKRNLEREKILSDREKSLRERQQSVKQQLQKIRADTISKYRKSHGIKLDKSSPQDKDNPFSFSNYVERVRQSIYALIDKQREIRQRAEQLGINLNILKDNKQEPTLTSKSQKTQQKQKGRNNYDIDR